MLKVVTKETEKLQNISNVCTFSGFFIKTRKQSVPENYHVTIFMIEPLKVRVIGTTARKCEVKRNQNFN